MTLQTDRPITAHTVNSTNRSGEFFLQLAKHGTADREGGLELDAPYQRGHVWSVAQQQLLMRSFLAGIPIPAVVINNRLEGNFRDREGLAVRGH